MDNLTLWIFIGAVIAILFLFVILFIYILRMMKKEMLKKALRAMEENQQTKSGDPGNES